MPPPPSPDFHAGPALVCRVASRLDALPALADALAQWCAGQRLPDAEALRLTLIVEELLTNTVQHGYRDRDDGWMALRLERAAAGEGEVVHLVLSDGAPHFDPTARAPLVGALPGAALDGLAPGGLGIEFVRRLVLRWQHHALDAGNRLELWRRVGAAPIPPN